MNIQTPDVIYLYAGSSAKTLNVEELVDYLRIQLPKFRISVRPNLTDYYFAQLPSEQTDAELDKLAFQIASCRVRNLMEGWTPIEPMYGEIAYEKRRLQGKSKAVGVLYDGFGLSAVSFRLIDNSEKNPNCCHIVLTDQLFGTWDEDDRRYHARVGVFAQPSILSTTGLVEAPAKPKDFYILKQQSQILGQNDLAVAKLKEEFRGRFIDYDDERLTEVMKGYVMQAVFYQLTGEPFCPEPTCRLYNAHWQEEVIRAQLENKAEFCAQHSRILADLR
ncbi:TPA: hypothetical protein EYP66_21580 [Candidatus Poribacteria bacterium]|nr:hypothetical protein [Candidatus Poribacteria bacterium]